MGYQYDCGTSIITTPAMDYRVTITENGSGLYNIVVDAKRKVELSELDNFHCIVEILNGLDSDPEASAINEYIEAPETLNTYTTVLNADISCETFYNTPRYCRFRCLNSNEGNKGNVEKLMINFTTRYEAPGRFRLVVSHNFNGTSNLLYNNTIFDNIRNGQTITLSDYITNALDTDMFQYDHAEVNGVTSTTLTCNDESDVVILYYTKKYSWWCLKDRINDLGLFNHSVDRFKGYSFIESRMSDGIIGRPVGFMRIFKFTTGNNQKAINMTFRGTSYLITDLSYINVQTGTPTSYITSGTTLSFTPLSPNTVYYVVSRMSTSTETSDYEYIDYKVWNNHTVREAVLSDEEYDYYPQQSIPWYIDVPYNESYVAKITFKLKTSQFSLGTFDSQRLYGRLYVSCSRSFDTNLNEYGEPLSKIDPYYEVFEEGDVLYVYLSWVPSSQWSGESSWKDWNPTGYSKGSQWVGSETGMIYVYTKLDGVVVSVDSRDYSNVVDADWGYAEDWYEYANATTRKVVNSPDKQYEFWAMLTSTPHSVVFEGWKDSNNNILSTKPTFRMKSPNPYSNVDIYACYVTNTTPFDWDTPKVRGEECIITANEWNRLTRKILGAYYGNRRLLYYNGYYDTKYFAEVGEAISAEKYNNLINYINDRFNLEEELDEVNPGDPITIESLEILKTTLNNRLV